MNSSKSSFSLQNGTLNFPQPITENNSLMMSFIFKSDINTLQTVCDNWLNLPTNNELYYQPVLPIVMVTYANTGGAFPSTPPFNQWGLVQYNEVICSIFVLRVKKLGPLWVSEYLSVLVPYIFVTDPMAMTSGREIYGMPKSLASVQLPNDPASGNKKFSLSVLSAPTFQANVPFVEMIINTITQISDNDLPTLTDWKNVGEAVNGIRKLIFGDGHIELPGINIVLEIAKLVFNKKLPFTSLRQVRSISDPTETVYKAVCEFDAQFEKLNGGGIMHGTYQINLPTNGIYPMGPDLGLVDGQIAEAAFWINWNFTFEAGNEIWSA